MTTPASALPSTIRAALQQARAVSQSLDDHPAKYLPHSLRERYLAAMAMVAWVDGPLNEEESAKLQAIARGLQLAEGAALSARQLGQAPTPDLLAELLDGLLGEDLRFLLVFELLAVALADGTMHPMEQELIGELMELLRLREKEVDWLAKLAFGFAMRDGARVRDCQATATEVGIPFALFEEYASLADFPLADLDVIVVESGVTHFINQDSRLTQHVIVESGGKLHIRGAVIELSDDAQIQVRGELLLENASIGGSERGQAGYLIAAWDASRIVVKDSFFYGISRPGMALMNCPSVLIMDSKFESCENHVGDFGWAIAIHNQALKSLIHRTSGHYLSKFKVNLPVIQNCQFEDCGQDRNKPVITIDLRMDDENFSSDGVMPQLNVVRHCDFGEVVQYQPIRAKVAGPGEKQYVFDATWD